MNAELSLRELRATPVMVPLAYPVHTASGTIGQAPLVLIDLLTQQGVQGRAYLFTYTPLALKATVALLRELDPLLRGMAVEPRELQRLLDARFRLLGNTGLVSMAIAGIDMAAWDALARAAGWPLAKLLGGGATGVPAYFSQGMESIERSQALAQEALERGFKAMKIKIGHARLEDDLAVVRAVQAVLAGRAGLFVDYNQSLSVPEALRRCRALDELGLGWIEEPTLQHDHAGHARIAQEVRTPIQLGENHFGTHEMAQALQAQASDLVMPDLMKIGGVSGWLHAASLAQGARVPMSSHIFQEFSAHLMAATPTAHWLEFLDIAGPVLQRPLQVVEGHVMPGEGPGAGLEWDAEAVARWRVP